MEALLRLEHVSMAFPTKGKGSISALQDVNLEIFKGESLGLAGESGCGKSTLARTIMGVYPGATGNMFYHGKPLNLRRRKARLAFAEKVQMIFQDPYASLNPRMTVEDVVGENLVIQNKCSTAERKKKVSELLEAVGLQSAYGDRYPNEFSGGQRQRIGIARALAVEPELLICDEPISALDVSVQGQIMNLLKRLSRERGLAYLFIAHDLNMVQYLSDRVAVMYGGRIVENAPTQTLYEAPRHPYTQLLLDAVLPHEPGKALGGNVQSGTEASVLCTAAGCPFAGQCTRKTEQCMGEQPTLLEVKQAHFVSCHRAKEDLNCL